MEKPLWLIYITHMFIEIYLLIHVALIPVIIREFQLSLLEASLVATLPSLVALLMNIPSGFFTDRFSTNTLLFVSMLIEGVSALFISQTSSFWMLVFGVSLMKTSYSLYHVSGLSWISRLTSPERMSMSAGFHNAFGNLGSASGVISLAVFLSTLGWRWTYLFWAFPIIIWGFIIAMSSHLKIKQFEKTETESRGRSPKLSLTISSPFLIFLVTISAREVGITGSTTFMTTYFVKTRSLSDSIASLVFGLGPFIGIVGALSGGYLGYKVGAKKALSWAMFGCAISLSILSLMSQLYLLVFIYLLYAYFNKVIWTPMDTIVADITPRAERGVSYSAYFFTQGLIASFAPTLAAGVIELSDVWYIFPFSVVFLITSLVILQFLPHPRRH